MRIIIFGTGQFGRALAALALSNHHEVITWSFRENIPLEYLPSGDIYISTLNASGVEQMGGKIREIVNGKPIISATKAFVHAGHITEILPSRILGPSALVLAGPNLASEMLVGLPTGATVSGNYDHFLRVREVLRTPLFSIEYSSEKTSVELMGIMKNIIAIGIGMIDGFGLGGNLKGIFIAKMTQDIRQLAIDIFDADFDITTLYAGIGDLFTTCSSTESRNHGFGLYFSRTKSIKTAKEFMNTSIEGLWSIEVLRPILLKKYEFLTNFLELFDDCGEKIEKDDFVNIFSFESQKDLLSFT